MGNEVSTSSRGGKKSAPASDEFASLFIDNVCSAMSNFTTDVVAGVKKASGNGDGEETNARNYKKGRKQESFDEEETVQSDLVDDVDTVDDGEDDTLDGQRVRGKGSNSNNRRESRRPRPKASFDDDTFTSEMDESTVFTKEDDNSTFVTNDDGTMVTDYTDATPANGGLSAPPTTAHYDSKPLASSFAKKCFFTKAGIGKSTQHYEGLALNGQVILMLASAMKLKGCPTICDEDLRRVEKTYPNQFLRLPDELLLSSGWRRISKYCHFSNKPIADGVPFFHSRDRLHPNGGYFFLLASAIGMVRPIDIEPMTRDHLILLETDFPTQCDAAPSQLIQDSNLWILVRQFCFFSGGPINTVEDVYYEAVFESKKIFMLAFLSPALSPEELYLMDNNPNHDPNNPIRMSTAAVQDVESVYDLTDQDFADLKLYHMGPCRALPENLLHPSAWTKILPPHFITIKDQAMLRAQQFEDQYGKIPYQSQSAQGQQITSQPSNDHKMLHASGSAQSANVNQTQQQFSSSAPNGMFESNHTGLIQHSQQTDADLVYNEVVMDVVERPQNELSSMSPKDKVTSRDSGRMASRKSISPASKQTVDEYEPNETQEFGVPQPEIELEQDYEEFNQHAHDEKDEEERKKKYNGRKSKSVPQPQEYHSQEDEEYEPNSEEYGTNAQQEPPSRRQEEVSPAVRPLQSKDEVLDPSMLPTFDDEESSVDEPKRSVVKLPNQQAVQKFRSVHKPRRTNKYEAEEEVEEEVEEKEHEIKDNPTAHEEESYDEGANHEDSYEEPGFIPSKLMPTSRANSQGSKNTDATPVAQNIQHRASVQSTRSIHTYSFSSVGSEDQGPDDEMSSYKSIRSRNNENDRGRSNNSMRNRDPDRHKSSERRKTSLQEDEYSTGPRRPGGRSKLANEEEDDGTVNTMGSANNGSTKNAHNLMRQRRLQQQQQTRPGLRPLDLPIPPPLTNSSNSLSSMDLASPASLTTSVTEDSPTAGTEDKNSRRALILKMAKARMAKQKNHESMGSSFGPQGNSASSPSRRSEISFSGDLD